ncbi:hypothetical protein [Arcticibacter tournemirensis]
MTLFLSVYFLFCSTVLIAQKVDKPGKNTEIKKSSVALKSKSASEEKKTLTLSELNVLTASISDTGMERGSNNDVLILDGTEYTFIRTPVNSLHEKAYHILREDDEIVKHGTFGKRYVLQWEVKNDSLYIVGYNLAANYEGNRTKEDIRKEIERLWKKTFRNGELVVDWMVVKDAPKTTVRLLVRDKMEVVYCLTFEKNRFMRIEEWTSVKKALLGIN